MLYKVQLTNDEKMLKYLKRHKNKRISAWKIVHKLRILSYATSIMILRKQGYIIKNKREGKTNMF
jgi:adenosyl cobinamide kinase/adenosyl cobinamide phosphate guanylyltransferase